MKRRVWLLGDRKAGLAAKVRSLVLIPGFLIMSLLLGGAAYAQSAGESGPGGITEGFLNSSVGDAFQSLPVVGPYGRYFKGSVWTLYVGKIHSMARHFRYELESTGATVPLIRHVNYIGSQYGVWLGTAWKASLSDYVGLNVQGWSLFPTKRPVYGTYMNNLSPPTPGDLPEAMDFWREWSPSTDGWFMDVFFTVNPGLTGYGSGIGLVFGGRYDSYYRSLKQSLARGRSISADGDEMQMTATLFVPYIGMQVGRDAPGYDLAVRMIGTPIVFGGLKHSETFGGLGVRDEGWFPFDVPRGYWAELFVEGGVRVTGGINLGGFLKMTTMTLMSNADLTRSSVTGAPSQEENYDLIYRRLTYTYGAKVALHF
ncbi:MAG: hypothetical protein V1792_17555 [Pseudomonadota bacterium]